MERIQPERMQLPQVVRLGGDVGRISSLLTKVEFRNVEELLGNDTPLGLRAVEGELTRTLRTEKWKPRSRESCV